jgi:hypothetical protein
MYKPIISLYDDMASYKDLPNDVIMQIFAYCGIVKLRNGKWINQISPIDVRYSLLRTIPRPRNVEGSSM